MFQGVVVYRDLLEQKGPLLYFVHGLAWLVSHSTFIGVYFLELIAAFFFLYYSYKVMALYCGDNSLFLIPVLGFFVYSSTAFAHGDSAEELCLPFLAYATWVALQALEQDRDFTHRECLAIGITSGCVFWTKFSLVGFYLGWFIVPMCSMLKQKRFKKLLIVIAEIAGGVILVTIPFLIYFGVNHAIGDWFEVYFYDNLFFYQSHSNEHTLVLQYLYNLVKGCGSMGKNFMSSYVAWMLGVSWAFLTHRRKVAAQIFLMLFVGLFLAYVGGKSAVYYALLMAPAITFGLIFLYRFLTREADTLNRLLSNKIAWPVTLVVCLGLSLLCTSNRYMLSYSKEDLPQYQFAEIIDQKENATLLNYGFLDGGFYTVADIVPNCKVFCKLNMTVPEFQGLQDDYIENGMCDFVVTRDQELETDNYTCIAESSFYFEGRDRLYRLYALN